ncbi:ankyrin repeat domain-containing protein [Bordetella sp. 15P40C-2]|uniref:ankyrin repeat domain-containing protein n=1 Tax=Bordetella sp. 15P40C-2 TaxID=2572246 RepID=UPI001323CE1A|nr:ankyrin repeat domain-containing protein [Bordetella sp. 15P40C-2]MVW72995.1 hypothetical protein [Bordetella sp. 15P40C-2]
MATLRFDGGQNCLHHAIQSGCYAIVLHLTHGSEPWMLSLINEPDDMGYTPLKIAIEAGHDLPFLVDALLTAGVHDDRVEALVQAAARGHLQATAQLISAGANPSIALARAVQHHMQVAPQAMSVKVLRAFGADMSMALDVAVEHGWLQAIRILPLLGAQSSAALIAAALRNDSAATETLIKGGADVPQALTRLAKDGMNDAVAYLMAQQSKHCRPFGYDSYSMLQLANSGEIAAMQVLAPHMIEGAHYCRGLAERGNVEALRVLIDAGRVNPNDLISIVRESDLKAARTLIQAGVSTQEVLRELGPSGVHREISPERYKKIRLLHAAGADTSLLAARDTVIVLDELARRRALFANLSADEKNAHLLRVALNGNVPDAALLLELGADPSVALKELNADWDVGARYVLIKAGMDTRSVLLDLVRAGDMDTARALVLTHGVSTDILIQLVRGGDMQTARAFIPALTDGSDELIEAATANDQELASQLLALGADGPRALLRLLAGCRHEAAGRLIAWNIDLDVTLMLAYRHREHIFGHFDPTVPHLLMLMGADLANALRQAQGYGEIGAAKRLLSDHPALGRDALLRLSEGTPDFAKRAALQFLLVADVDVNGVIELLAHDRQHLENLARLKTLIALGLPTAEPLMDLTRAHHRNTAMNVIDAGGDLASAMNRLIQNAAQHTQGGDREAARLEQDAANQLAIAVATLAPAWAREFDQGRAGSQVVISPK